jgi:hypothetical protein
VRLVQALARLGPAALALAALLAVCLPSAAAPASGVDACGVPQTGQVWVDYAGHDAPVPVGDNRVLAVSSGTEGPAAMRQAGAGTIFFDLNFNNRIGTPSAPADPDTIVDRANRLYDYAVGIAGCDTPIIAENELFGAQTTTPWSATNAQYRANALALLKQLAARGAKPAITIANPPYTGGEAADWWRQTAQVALLVRQVYFRGPQLYRAGPILASRMIRDRLRQTVATLGAIGIPASRIALELQFQSAPGEGGREGLEPTAAWYEVVKLQGLAAVEVARELPIAGIWSWGWATFSNAGFDPDKEVAACVYFWARSPALCNAPAKAAAAGFNPSRTEGQLASLPASVSCSVRGGLVTRNAVGDLARLTHDIEVASSAVVEQIVQKSAAQVSGADVRRAEGVIVRERFGGSMNAYLGALRDVGATLATARSIIGAQLRRDTIEQGLRPDLTSAAAVAGFYERHGDLAARPVRVDPAPTWLGGAATGLAIAPFAPEQVLRAPANRTTTVQTARGPVSVTPLGPEGPLAAFSPEEARTALTAAVRGFVADAAYEAWLQRKEQALLPTAICRRDHLPALGAIDLTAYAPFLDLFGV